MSDNNFVKVRGIVTRAVQYKENDKILTVLTAELGLISVYCYGAKSNRSKFLTPSRLFCYSEFVLARKKEHYYAKEADYIEAFFNISNDMDKLFLGQYFLEVANEVCVEGERQDGFLRLLLNSLYALSADLCDAKKIKSVFELRACSEMGLAPEVSGCRKCGKTKADIMYFDVLNGDFVCPDCVVSAAAQDAFAEQNGYTGSYCIVNPSVMGAIEYVSSAPIERVFSFTLTDEAFALFSACSEKYLLNQVGKAFMTLDMYNGQIR